ncbi:MAG TPA: rhodanese-like domain-containing protein [Gammaproteobacteria bacterium]|nr:rhodanese-like domain-containing protein [Gammaproteobacteria bacterium]
MLLRAITLFTFLLTLISCSEPPYENLDNTQLKAMMAQGVPVFDIRRAEEWRQTGVIEGSQLLTFVDKRGQVLADFMPRFTGATDKSKPVILICRSGNRSSILARHLVEEMGFTQVYNVRDGMNQWLKEKNSITRKNL